MKVLEDELGTELIRRSNRRFQLTDIGEYFYSRSKDIVKETEDLKEEIRKMNSKQSKQFRIGCRSGYIVRRLCTAMNTFLDDNKDISMEVVYGDHDELMAMLHKGELDMVFNDLRHENEATSFGSFFMEEVEGMVAVSVRSTLAKQDEVEVEDLSHYTCVLLSSEKHQEKEKNFFRMIFHTENNFALARNLPSALTMVINNVGFMPVVSNFDAHEFLGKFAKLLPVKRAGEALHIKYYAFYNKEYSSEENKNIINKVVELLK